MAAKFENISNYLINYRPAAGITSSEIPNLNDLPKIRSASAVAVGLEVVFNPTIPVGDFPTEGQRLKFGLEQNVAGIWVPITWVPVADFPGIQYAPGGQTHVQVVTHVLQIFPLMASSLALKIDNDQNDPFLTGEVEIDAKFTLMV